MKITEYKNFTAIGMFSKTKWKCKFRKMKAGSGVGVGLWERVKVLKRVKTK